MLEIEQKFAHVDFGSLEQRLAQWGVSTSEEHVEVDHYHNAPDRDFARTGEAFRLRRIGAASLLTYKGPRIDPAVKVRPEIEVGLASGDEAAEDTLRLLGHLGYRPVAVVRKRRRSYRLQRDGFEVVVCLDDVENVGRFVEVEVLAPPEQLAAARAALTATAAALGLTDVEPRAYLTMLLAARTKDEGPKGQRHD
jgi:adenylate cyclase class 2